MIKSNEKEFLWIDKNNKINNRREVMYYEICENFTDNEMTIKGTNAINFYRNFLTKKEDTI